MCFQWFSWFVLCFSVCFLCFPRPLVPGPQACRSLMAEALDQHPPQHFRTWAFGGVSEKMSKLLSDLVAR